MKHWIDPNEVEPHGSPASANGLIVMEGKAIRVTIAAGYLVMDSYAWARSIGRKLESEIRLGRMGGGARVDQAYSRIARQLFGYADGKYAFTPGFIPLILRAQILPRRVVAANGDLRPYSRKLMAVSEIGQHLKAPDFILEVRDDTGGSIRVIHKFAYVADYSGDVDATVVDDKLIIHEAVAILKRALDYMG